MVELVLTMLVSIDTIGQVLEEPRHMSPTVTQGTYREDHACSYAISNNWVSSDKPAEIGGQLLKAQVAVLQEISARDYSGGTPPEKSYEVGVVGDDLFAFAWDSKYFRRRMYFKFCLHKENEEDLSLYIASLHPENPSKRRSRT
jgi:hypothetical protein